MVNCRSRFCVYDFLTCFLNLKVFMCVFLYKCNYNFQANNKNHLTLENNSFQTDRFSVGSNNVQLASTRGTRYQTVLLQPPHSGDQAVYLQRESLRFTDTLRPGFSPAYSEVDVVGVVVLIQGAGNSPGKRYDAKSDHRNSPKGPLPPAWILKLHKNVMIC